MHAAIEWRTDVGNNLPSGNWETERHNEALLMAGGSAHPCEMVGPFGEKFLNPGITVLDYFAAHAVPALITSSTMKLAGLDMRKIAADAYAIARAMREERER